MNGLQYFSQPTAPHGLFWNNDPSTHPVNELIRQLLCQNIKFDTPNALAADLGCGPGNSILPLAVGLGLKKIIAIDGAPDMLSFIDTVITGCLPEVRIHTLRVNLEEERIALDSGCLLLANCTSTIPYLASIENLFTETSRILQTGGYFSLKLKLHKQPNNLPIAGQLQKIDYYVYSEKYFFRLIQDLGFQCITMGSEPIDRQGISVPIFDCSLILKKTA